jgi:hypothetical protein
VDPHTDPTPSNADIHEYTDSWTEPNRDSYSHRHSDPTANGNTDADTDSNRDTNTH